MAVENQNPQATQEPVVVVSSDMQPTQQAAQPQNFAPTMLPPAENAYAQATTAAVDQMQTSPIAQDALSWQAAEFVAHHKTPQWFLTFGLASVALIGVIFLITKDVFAIVATTLGAIAVGYYAGKTPQTQQFRMDNSGFEIGSKYYAFRQFKSYSIIREGEITSVQFLPLKRFLPYTTIYFGPQEEQLILALVERTLPFVESGGDPIDRLLRRVRF